MRMLAGKLFYTAVMLAIISLVSFAAVALAPNAVFNGGELNPNMSPEAVAHLASVYGLDKPLLERYWLWAKAMATFDFGVSFASGEDAGQMILERLPVTLLLNGISMVVIFLIAVPLGVASAKKGSSWEDRALVQGALATFAMPSVYLALMLLMLFSVGLGWFPLGGLHGFDAVDGTWGYYLDYARHLVLPVTVMIVGGIGSLFLYVRSLTLEILKSDYIFFAYARGVDPRTLYRRYILPNLAPPLVTMLGLSLPGLVGGSVILESIFSIQGMGMLFYQSAMSRDYPVIMGILMMTAFLTLAGNILADAILLKLNPFSSAR